MSVDRIVASSELLGLVLLISLIAIGVRNRSYFREVATDPDREWRLIARVAVAQLVLFIAWTSIFDNWRQLTGIPFHAIKEFPSERVEIDPPSHDVRLVTLVLLGLTLAFFGALLARHVGGYFLQLTIVAGALAAWIPLFVIRQRFSLNLAFGFTGSWTSVGDVTGWISFVVLTYFWDISLIAVCFFALVGVAAIPMTLLLDVTRTRRPRVTGEAKPFFSSIHDHAGAVRN